MLLCTLALAALAQLPVENFDHGSEALWPALNLGMDTLDLTADAARAGAFGAQFRQTAGNAAWRGRLDLVSNPNSAYRAAVRSRGTATSQVQFGRSYFGIGADVDRALCATFAPNSNQILLQSVTGFTGTVSFVTLASAAAPIQQDTWYLLEIDWRNTGEARVTLFDELGTNVLAQIPYTATTFLAPGGFALRGFTQNTAAFHDLDEIQLVQQVFTTNYCGPAVPNSTGSSAVMGGVGSIELARNDVELIAGGLPPGSFGFFLTGRTQGFIANPGNSQGNLCLSGAIGRYQGNIFAASSQGQGRLRIDLTQMPTATGTVAAAVGETWSFQAWYRDANPVPTSNFTDGLALTWQ